MILNQYVDIVYIISVLFIYYFCTNNKKKKKKRKKRKKHKKKKKNKQSKKSSKESKDQQELFKNLNIGILGKFEFGTHKIMKDIITKFGGVIKSSGDISYLVIGRNSKVNKIRRSNIYKKQRNERKKIVREEWLTDSIKLPYILADYDHYIYNSSDYDDSDSDYHDFDIGDKV